MTRVGAHNLEQHERTHPTTHSDTTRRAVAFLGKIHKIALSGFGPVTRTVDGLRGTYDSWQAAILEGVDDTLHYLLQQNIIDEPTAAECRQAFATHAHILSCTDGKLLHGDYHAANIVVDDNGEMAGAVDLTQAKVGDPAFDVAFYATYIDTGALSTFLDGYEHVAGSIPDRRQRLALYRMRILLSKAKLRKRLGYEERIADAVKSIRDALAELR